MATVSPLDEATTLSSTSGKTFFKHISLLTWIIVGVSTLALVAMYVFSVSSDDSIESQSGWKWVLAVCSKLFEAIAPNVIAAFLAFIASYLVIRPIEQMRSQSDTKQLAETVLDTYSANHDPKVISRIRQEFIEQHIENGAIFIPDFHTFNANRHLKDAKHVNIVTVFLGGWFELHSEKFADFLKADGKLSVVIPNTANKELIDFLAFRFKDKTADQIVERIHNTEKTLLDLRQSVSAKENQLEFFKIDQYLNYFAIAFDKRYLFMSFYEHKQVGPVRAPSLLIKLSANPSVANWFAEELLALKTSTQPTPKKYLEVKGLQQEFRSDQLGRIFFSIDDKVCARACQYCFTFDSSYKPFQNVFADGVFDALRELVVDKPDVVLQPASDIEITDVQDFVGKLDKLADLGNSISFATKGDMSPAQVSALAAINNKLVKKGKCLQVCISMPLFNDWRKFESKTSPPNTRLALLKKLHSAGIKTSVAIRPMMPMTDDTEIRKIVDQTYSYCYGYISGPLYIPNKMINQKAWKQSGVKPSGNRSVQWMRESVAFDFWLDRKRIDSAKNLIKDKSLQLFEDNLDLVRYCEKIISRA